MTTKKSQLRRLLAIYTLFMLLLLGGLAHSYADFARGFREGYRTAESWANDGGYYKYLLMDVPVYADVEKVENDSADAEIMTERVNVIVRKASDENPIKLAFRSLGDSGYLYWAILVLPLAKLSIFILMGIIFVSLRRSVREELPLNRRNILCTRLIGIILIGTEVLEGAIAWCMRTGAAEVLNGESMTVDTSFPLSYWNLLMGVLMLFMAEVFAIGTRLGEEQKLTI